MHYTCKGKVYRVHLHISYPKLNHHHHHRH